MDPDAEEKAAEDGDSIASWMSGWFSSGDENSGSKRKGTRLDGSN